MRHRRGGFKLSRNSAHRAALLRNLSISLIEHERIRTTITKAKFVRPFLERLVTRAGRGKDVHNLRVLSAKLNNQIAVKKLLDAIAPKYAARNGGYLRIVRIGARKGDNAEMAVIEFV